MKSCPTAKRPIDHHLANVLIESALRRIAEDYRRGALPWTKRHRPRQWKELKRCEGIINGFAIGSDMAGLRQALEDYRRLVSQIVLIFEEGGRN